MEMSQGNTLLCLLYKETKIFSQGLLHSIPTNVRS